MGMYDSFFYNGTEELQLKNGECGLNEFHIGDDVSKFGFDDGIYLDDTEKKGVVVIFGGFYVAGFNKDVFFNKYGCKIDFDSIIAISYY